MTFPTQHQIKRFLGTLLGYFIDSDKLCMYSKLKRWQLVIERGLEISVYLKPWATEISINSFLVTQLYRKGGET